MITNPDAKRVLVFGDSLSWGYNPGSNHERLPANERWPGVMQDLLGDGYEVIEECLNSRAIENVDHRPGKEGRRALDYIEACLDTHDPLDIVIVQLGSNELKHEYDNTPEDIGRQVEELLTLILNRPSQFRPQKPAVVLMAPPVVDETSDYCSKGDKYLGATEKSKQLGAIYGTIADHLALGYFNMADFVTVGADGAHIDAVAHGIVGQQMAEIIERV